MEYLKETGIEELLSIPAVQKMKQAMDVIEEVQRNVYAVFTSEDSQQLDLLKIGSVFQIFLIDTLAGGKKPEDLTKEDWLNIAEKVSRYAVLEDGQTYSEFVFTMYADYIDLSAETLCASATEEQIGAIKEISATIRNNTEKLRAEEIDESAYVDACLWLSLEAMIKLISLSLTSLIGPEFSKLAQAASQLAFEYGRYILYAKEQAILESYLQNQKKLDEHLRNEYDAFLTELQEYAERFQGLIDAAFSPELHNSLLQSAELARQAGVEEGEILESIDDIDAFFMD